MATLPLQIRLYEIKSLKDGDVEDKEIVDLSSTPKTSIGMILMVFARTSVQDCNFHGSMGHFTGMRRTLGGIVTMPPNSTSQSV